MKFSVITVCYQAGEKLHKTIHNILEQTWDDYEIIIKDGKSGDRSVEKLKQEPDIAKEIEKGRLRIYVEPDHGVYDGMNQAIKRAKGEYLIFMNSGDTFYSPEVLKRTAQKMGEIPADLYYGDTACEQTGAVDYTAPQINGFTCYRNIPCHQSCFYAASLFREKQYDTSLKIRADYDHFLWCYYQQKCVMAYLGFVVSAYEGGGISEQDENRELDLAEHVQIIARYMSPAEIRQYKIWMFLSLAPLRRAVAENKKLAGVYQKIKNVIYHR